MKLNCNYANKYTYINVNDRFILTHRKGSDWFAIICIPDVANITFHIIYELTHLDTQIDWKRLHVLKILLDYDILTQTHTILSWHKLINVKQRLSLVQINS